MKLLGSTETKINKDKNRENVPHLEVVELVLVHCNLREYCLLLYQTSHSVAYYKFHQQVTFF